MEEKCAKRWMKYLVCMCVLVAGIAAVYLVGTGLMKRTDVFVGEYILSDDGEMMTVRAGVAGSMGYIRDVSVKQEGERLCLIFYSAFGGLNGNWGAHDEFTFCVDSEALEIAVYRGTGTYEVILEKVPETGEWARIDSK